MLYSQINILIDLNLFIYFIMDFDIIVSGIKNSAVVIANNSKVAINYIKSDEFKNKVKRGYNDTKDSISNLIEKI